MDFGALPPEVNSGRMYTGAGPGPMTTAAAAWSAVADELYNAASGYESVLFGLTGNSGSWHGPASALMASAAAPYVAWLSATAGQAEQTAAQAQAAVAAYETAFAATVPPPVIAANRVQLMALIATNVFGQNTPAIMATEAEYTEMWAQDAVAMYGYAGSSASAAQLKTFTLPPQTTVPAGQSAQAAAVTQAAVTPAENVQATLTQLTSTVPGALQSLASTGSSGTSAATSASGQLTAILTQINGITGNLVGPATPYSYLFPNAGVPYLLGLQSVLLPQNGQGVATVLSGGATKALVPSSLLPSAGALSPGLSGATSTPTVSAGMGHAGLVGGLSVPRGWTTAAPVIRNVVAMVPDTGMGTPMTADVSGSLYGNMALSSMVGRAVAGTGVGAAFPRPTTASIAAAAAGSQSTTATIIVIPPADA